MAGVWFGCKVYGIVFEVFMTELSVLVLVILISYRDKQVALRPFYCKAYNYPNLFFGFSRRLLLFFNFDMAVCMYVYTLHPSYNCDDVMTSSLYGIQLK